MAQEREDSRLHGRERRSGAPLPGPDAHDNSIDIFPWHEIFNTGLPEVDSQHRVLGRLLNALANQFAFNPDRDLLDQIVAALSAYADSHFRTEDAVWASCLPDDAEMAAHRAGHENFSATVQRFQAESAGKPVVAAMEEMLTFLAHWLVTHILEHDHYFARVARGVQGGLAPEQARQAADAEMRCAMRALIGPMHATYNALAANAAKLAREMAERKHAEVSLQESEERFRTIVEESPVGIILHQNGRVLQVNEAAVRMFRYASRADLQRADVFENIAPESRTEVQARALRRLQGEAAEAMYETVGLRRDGTRFPLVLVPRVMRTPDGPVIGAFLMDLTEAKRAEEAERSLNRTVKLLSRCNALLVRAADEVSLLAGVCQLAVEVGGYRMAWVGYAEDDAEQSVRPAAQYGDDSGYIEAVRASWADTERGCGGVGRSIRSGQCAIVHDIARAPGWAIWREAALARGYRSAIALPLQVEHKTIGTLGIYSGNALAFRTEEVALLEELARDLSMGIEALRLREAKEAALRDLRRESDKNRALLHNASDAVHILDEHGHLIEASDSFFAMLGCTRAELMGKHLTAWDATIWPPGEPERNFRRVLACDTRQEIHTRHRRKDGSIIHVEISILPLTLEGRRVLFNSSRDVTESLRIRTELEQTTQNLRRLLADFESTLEAERSHIAREVHDELGQILTSLGFAISTIRVKYGAANGELRQIAQEMTALNARALQVARNVAENLRPAALDMGLVAALEWLCGKMRAQTAMDCRFRVTGDLGDMEQAQVDVVFRIAQESLTNAMRHAGPCRVALSLALHEDGLHLTVHDDGRGFDPALTPRKSFGLAGMKERVRGMGGAFRVTSAPDEGTTVVAHMPYRRKGTE